MTKLNTDWQQDIIPDFDVMKWKQETQAAILRETAGMSSEEICKYFRQASERAAIRRKELAERRAAENPK
jgi:hypothetical protein